MLELRILVLELEITFTPIFINARVKNISTRIRNNLYPNIH